MGETNSMGLPLYVGCALLAISIFVVDLAVPLGVAGGVPYVAVVLLSLWAPDKRFTLVVSVVCSILTIGGFLYSPAGGEMWQVICNRALALIVIWVTAGLTLQRKIGEEKREEAVLEREKALEDVKILRGFFPICASCKNIRDDKGYWNQIETYIRDHSEADFSHGLCPVCAKKLFPEIYKE